MARSSLQMAWDAADSAAGVVTLAAVMRRSSCLQSVGLSQEVQSSIQDLPFNGSGFFSEQTDVRLHGVKDS